MVNFPGALNLLLSIDFIFSNWLLMYLSDEELMSFMKKMLSWLRPGGFLFFRESCNHRSGTKLILKFSHLPYIIAMTNLSFAVQIQCLQYICICCFFLR